MCKNNLNPILCVNQNFRDTFVWNEFQNIPVGVFQFVKLFGRAYTQ